MPEIHPIILGVSFCVFMALAVAAATYSEHIKDPAKKSIAIFVAVLSLGLMLLVFALFLNQIGWWD